MEKGAPKQTRQNDSTVTIGFEDAAISRCGQVINATTRRLGVMNLALRGIEADLGEEHADTFRRDLRADFVLAKPLFNDSDWFRKVDDVCWHLGVNVDLSLTTREINIAHIIQLTF